MIEHIQQGRVYRAVRPRQTGNSAFDNGFVNDRVVVYVSEVMDLVQYDGPAVANGRVRPKCTIKAFQAWASEDVTDKMPVGEWQRWPAKLGGLVLPSKLNAAIEKMNFSAVVHQALNPLVMS